MHNQHAHASKNPNHSSDQPDANKQSGGFSILRADTINLWVWLQGHEQPLDEHSLKSVSEDISYRIRECTDAAVNYMHHCKRSVLRTSDMNKAFQMADVQVIDNSHVSSSSFQLFFFLFTALCFYISFSFVL